MAPFASFWKNQANLSSEAQLGIFMVFLPIAASNILSPRAENSLRGRNADKSHAGGSSLQTPGVPRLCHHQHTQGRRGDTGQRLTCAVQEEVMAGPRRAAHCRGPAAQGECETTACLQVVSKNSTNPLLCAQAPVPRDELHTPGAHTSPAHVGAPVIHCTPGPHTQTVW